MVSIEIDFIDRCAKHCVLDLNGFITDPEQGQKRQSCLGEMSRLIEAISISPQGSLVNGDDLSPDTEISDRHT